MAELEEKIRTRETTQCASIDVLYFTVTLRTKSGSKEKHYEIRTLNLKFKIVCVGPIYIIIAPTDFKMVKATTYFLLHSIQGFCQRNQWKNSMQIVGLKIMLGVDPLCSIWSWKLLCKLLKYNTGRIFFIKNLFIFSIRFSVPIDKVIIISTNNKIMIFVFLSSSLRDNADSII